MGNDPVNKADPSGQEKCPSQATCYGPMYENSSYYQSANKSYTYTPGNMGANPSTLPEESQEKLAEMAAGAAIMVIAPEAIMLNAGTKFINPATVRFTQNSISSTFKNGSKISDMVKGLRSGAIKSEDVPPIRLVKMDGKLYSLDNRRLEAFRQAEVKVPYRMATQEEAEAEAWKFTTQNDGALIRIRGE